MSGGTARCSHLVDVVVALGGRLNAGAAVGKAVDERPQLAGVDNSLRVAVRLVADDHQRYVLGPPAAASAAVRGRGGQGVVAALRQEHLVLQAPSRSIRSIRLHGPYLRMLNPHYSCLRAVTGVVRRQSTG